VKKQDVPPGTRRATPIKRSFNARRVGQLLAAFFAVVFIIDGIVGDRGVLALIRARRQAAQLTSELERQRSENAALSEQARRLREDSGAIEEYARRTLGLIRPGEKVFIIKDLVGPGRPAEK
jgi:cell division protein FtsB